MSVVTAIAPYPWSRDYAALWEAAQRHSVVCVVDYDLGDVVPCRDIAHTIWTSPPDTATEWLQISARGICYAHAQTPEELAERGEKYNLVWLPFELPEVSG